MPVLDNAAEEALDEAMGLCLDPVGRQAELVRWLGRHPHLAANLAEDLAASEEVDQWMAPLRNGPTSHSDQTVSYPGNARPYREPASLDFGGFELLGELGRGAMGVVYKARDKALNKVVALKTTRDGSFSSKRDMARLQFEMEAAARLDHPNIVPIYGAGENLGMPFFSMKHVEGGTLAEGLEAQRKDLPKAAALMAKVATAVHYAHQRGIMHRDLKPGNILLETNGEPLVADFGLAKTVDTESSPSASGAIVGTAPYMPPEQARGDKALTTTVDVYSLGAILYELLTGRPPFQADSVYETIRQVIEQSPPTPRTLNRAAPPDLEAICLKCLEKNAVDRYPSAADLADDLERFSRGEDVSPRPRSVLSQIGRAFVGVRLHTSPPGEKWVSIVAYSSAVAAIGHGSIFALVATGSRMGWVWLALGAYLAILGGQRIGQAKRSRFRTTWERHTIIVWLGHFLSTVGLALAILPFDPNAPADRVLAWYPALAVTYVLVFFVQGSISYGAYFIASFIYLLLALTLRLVGTAAPLVFIAFHIPAMIILTRLATSRTYLKPDVRQ